MIKLEDIIEENMKRLLIVSAQVGAKPNKRFLESLNTYSKVNDAEIVVLPMAGKPYQKDEELHPSLQEYKVVDGNLRLNNNLQISKFRIKPQQRIPLTGIRSIVRNDTSTILAGTKQQFEYIASNDDLPKFIGTTGSVTEPHYNEENRIGQLALRDHEIGALVVELLDENYFNIRHIMSQKNGKFYDILGEYDGKKHTKVPTVDALVMGDTHYTHLNKEHFANTLDQIKRFMPRKALIDHDILDASEISHHNVGRALSTYRARQGGKMILEKELKTMVKYMNQIWDELPQTCDYIVPAANHNEHLTRWLEESRYIGDAQNTVLGHEAFLQVVKGNDPLKYLLNKYGLPDDVKFLTRNDSYKVRGIELGSHGDLLGYRRATARTTSDQFGKSVVAHMHSPRKFRKSYAVGTSTNLRVGYNSGVSNWLNANALVYPNGTVQMLNSFGKQYGVFKK